MTHAFTAATDRALQAARRYCSGPELDATAALLGLLAESECLAAVLLAERGIDPAAVLARFSLPVGDNITSPAGSKKLSAELELAIAAVRAQCADLPVPYELATEHLLLGMLLTGGEVADWLAEQGLDAALLEQLIRRRYRAAELREYVESTGDAESESDESLADQRTGHFVNAPTERFADEPAGDDSAAQKRAESTPGAFHARGQLGAWRALDASANRAREGLRVVEDYARFALDDAHLTGELKRLRHDLAEVLSDLPPASLQGARDTPGDVGTQISTTAELRRDDLDSIAAANFKRAIEALRSLEEFSKLAAPGLAPRFEQLRYRGYALERSLNATASSVGRLAGVRLCVLIDGGDSPAANERLTRALIDARAPMLQLRDKRLDDRELVARARRMRELTQETSTLLIVNDRADVARLAGADGVHLGQEDLSVRDARAIVGPEMLIGVSTHSIEQARQAVLEGASYIGVGPTFAGATKQFAAYPGPRLLAEVAAEIRLPAFAIGGVTLGNLPQVTAAGFKRIAVSGAVTNAPDPASACRELLAALRTAGAEA